MSYPHTILCLAVFAFLACSVPKPPEPRPPTPISAEISKGIDREIRLKVGPPEASLAAWVIEPTKGKPVRGTIIFLHGFLTSHVQVQGAAEALRKADYRAVMVDLRGFGLSTGGHYTFGVLDARDLTQLTDYLQANGLCGRTVGVFGTSYGAGSAILYAAADPRVTTVVAVAPFADIREEVVPFSRAALGPISLFLADETLNQMANVVSGAANLNLDDSRPLEAIVRTRAKVLLIHGDADDIVPHASSEKLRDAAPGIAQLISIPNKGHLELCFDVLGELRPATRRWFDEHLVQD